MVAPQEINEVDGEVEWEVTQNTLGAVVWMPGATEGWHGQELPLPEDDILTGQQT